MYQYTETMSSKWFLVIHWSTEIAWRPISCAPPPSRNPPNPLEPGSCSTTLQASSTWFICHKIHDFLDEMADLFNVVDMWIFLGRSNSRHVKSRSFSFQHVTTLEAMMIVWNGRPWAIVRRLPTWWRTTVGKLVASVTEIGLQNHANRNPGLPSPHPHEKVRSKRHSLCTLVRWIKHSNKIKFQLQSDICPVDNPQNRYSKLGNQAQYKLRRIFH